MVDPPHLPEQIVQALARLLDEDPASFGAGLDALISRWPDFADAIRSEAAALSRAANAPPTVATQDHSDRAPAHIGPYHILSEIGAGGMGTVYLAEQKTPVKRRVALKVIKLGMDTRAVLARFEAERQALALMDHSSIAKVFDAGVTETGRPYFAMEYVRGVPITRYCDDNRLSVEDRLALFRQVCSGVQHAHQKGVIHRDLTPNNVLVAVQDSTPVAKIIDFGLARATDHRLTEKTVFTEQGVIMGTPEYMSPEQAGLDALDIDMRSDVYTLGVLLYELLTGALPFSREQLRQAGYDKMCDIIRTQEPEKPSTRITRRARDSEIARLRRTDTDKLLRRLRGDLDWVVLKCLEKDRTRRYATVSELAADVQRHLEYEPVVARAPSVGYRLAKLAQRYRGQLVAAGLVFLALIAGLAGTTAFWLEAKAQAVEARRQEGIANDRARDAEVARAGESAKAKEAKENAATAGRNASLFAAKVRDFDQLAGLARLERLMAALDELALPWADLSAARRWLADADRILELRPELERTVANLRRQVVPRTREEMERDLLLHWERIPKVKVSFYGRPTATRDADAPPEEERFVERATLLNASGGQEATKEWLARVLRAPGLTREQVWNHERAKDEQRKEAQQFLLDALTDLLAKLAAFETSERSRIATRLRCAELSTAHPRARATWQQAAESIAKADGIAASESYQQHPIQLKPQLGLVPIGMNPQTKLWEFYELRSAWDPARIANPGALEIPVHDEDGRITVGDDTGIVFVLLPGGPFSMGAQREEKNGLNYDPKVSGEEGPPHAVTLAPFFLARHELTQGQWWRIVGNRSGQRLLRVKEIGDAYPVASVDWHACDALLRSHGLLLPTEAQWEFGARAGTTTPWWTGPDAAVAEAECRGFEPVGARRFNAFGLFDVLGGVKEWCADSGGLYLDPWRAGDGLRLRSERSPPTTRVHRGGSFASGVAFARSANRDDDQPAFHSWNLGVRPARPLQH